MADQEIDSISVSFTADTSGFTRGAQQAADTLSELGQSAERAGEEAQGLTGVLDAINASLARIESAVNASTSAVQQMTAALSGMSSTATAAEAVTQSVAQIGELSASAAGGVADVGEAAAAAGTGLSEVADGLQDAGKGLAQTEDKTDDCAKALEDMARQLDEARTRSDKLEAELSDLQEELDGIKDKAGSGDLFAGLAKGAAALGIGKLFKEAVDGAGELEQNIGGSASVFKEYAGTVQTAAKSAYESLGLSESKYLATATKMGALFQGTGSSIAASADMTTNAMKRAADVASIMGISIDDAMYSISGMAKGNFTMMDNLGVAMNDTTLQIYAQEKGLGKLETTQQKVNAAYQMFMDKTEYAARNYEKENATYAGSLTTLKAEFENFMAEAGTAVMPLVTQGIELLSGALDDLSPIITTVATGIGVVGDVIGALPEPLVKMATYVLTAAIAWKKLNAILGATASKLMLVLSIISFVLGGLQKIGEKYNELNSGIDDAAESTDDVTEAVDSLGSSAEKTSKSLKKLAGFDEITKLSGGTTTVASGIVSDEDLATIKSYTDEFNELSSELESGIDVSLNFDWDSTRGALEDIGTNITNLINGIVDGNLKTQYDALTRLNEYVKATFGDSWSEFWQKAGQFLYDSTDGAASEEDEEYFRTRDWYNAHSNDYSLQDLRTAITDYLKKGYSVEEAKVLGEIKFFDTPEKKEWYNKFLEEDPEKFKITYDDIKLWKKNLEESGQVTKDMMGILDTKQREALNALRAAPSYESTNISHEERRGYLLEQLDLNELYDDLKDSEDYSLRELQALVVEYLKQGESAFDAIRLAENDYLDTSGAIYWYQYELDKRFRLTDEQAEEWRRNLIESGQIGASNALNDPLTATDMMAIMGGAGGMMNGPLQINTTVEIDGEAVGRSVASYNNEQNYTSNGAAADR